MVFYALSETKGMNIEMKFKKILY